MTKALLIIDIQNDYFPGGKMQLVGSVEAAKNTARLLEHFRFQGWPVIHVQHIALKEGATFFLPNTSGAEIHSDVAPLEGETVIVKHFPNAFRETDLQKTLDEIGVRDLMVAGMMTHMCIDTSVRAANDLGYRVTLVGDACATKDLDFNGTKVAAANVQAAYLAAIDGSFASVVSTLQVLEL